MAALARTTAERPGPGAWPPVARWRTRAPRLLSQLLDRPRLTAELDREFEDHEAVAIIAAAGSGKTTLCAEYARTWRGDVSWLVLDRSSRDPSDFLAELAAALGQRLPHVVPDAQLTAIATALALRLEGQTRLIVLDDCDVLASAEQVNAILAAFIDHAPVGVRLLCTARADLPHILGERISRGRMAVLEDPALAFTAAEVETLAARRGIGRPEACAIAARSFGWALAVDVLAAPTAAAGARRSALERFIVREILQPLPVAERIFLQRSSVMESLTNDLVGAVLGEEARASWRCVRERRLPIRHEVDAAVAYVPVFRDILREQLELQEPAAVARLEARYRQTLIDSRADRVVPAAAAVRRITVETLGPDRDIRVDGRSCNIKRFKVIEFAALLSGSGRRLHRSAAQWALFPDADAARASNYFRQVLFQFRTHTGIEFRPNDRGYLELPDDVAIETTDQRLERALGHAARERDAVAFNALDEALGHAGAYLIDSDLEWAELRRFELDTIVEQARLIAARLALDLGRPDAAMRLARAALEADPDCEGAWEVLVGLGGAASAPDAHAAIAKRLRRVRDAFGATHAE